MLELGNGTSDRFTYDAKSFRLTWVRSTRPVPAGDQCSSAFNDASVQGSPLHVRPRRQRHAVRRRRPGDRLSRNQRIDPADATCYDALYRLISATGRENRRGVRRADRRRRTVLGRTARRPIGRRTRNYTERYRYDESATSSACATRPADRKLDSRITRTHSTTLLAPASNRLWQTWVGDNRAGAIAYRHDTTATCSTSRTPRRAFESAGTSAT